MIKKLNDLLFRLYSFLSSLPCHVLFKMKGFINLIFLKKPQKYSNAQNLYIFYKKIFFKILIVFLIGLLFRFIIKYYLNINVFTDIFSPVSLGYYYFMAFISQIINEMIENFYIHCQDNISTGLSYSETLDKSKDENTTDNSGGNSRRSVSPNSDISDRSNKSFKYDENKRIGRNIYKYDGTLQPNNSNMSSAERAQALSNYLQGADEIVPDKNRPLELGNSDLLPVNKKFLQEVILNNANSTAYKQLMSDSKPNIDKVQVTLNLVDILMNVK